MTLKQIENFSHFLNQIHESNNSDSNPEIAATLQTIKQDIRTKKDQAVIHYTKKFDQVSAENFNLKVSKEEIKNAYTKVSNSFIESVKKAKDNIETYHQLQTPKNWQKNPEPGVNYGIKYQAIEKVGLYVPGGRAPYFSTVLMNAIPALVAGVSQPVITTPPQKDGTVAPQILVAADCCGIEEIYKVGGSQAIFALAYGTETIPKVDKIVGPGNIFVDLAKQMVYGTVDIDKPAGPSDVLIYVEDSKYASFAAAEMLAQLEHDPNAIAITLSSKQTVLNKIKDEFQNQIQHLSRKDIIEESVKNSGLVLVNNQTDAIEKINEIAAEHLVLLLDNYQDCLDQVKHGGSIFCGPYTPVTLGDYFAGPNHVLPTSGTARFASPLGVMDFIKYSSYLSYNQENLKHCASHLKNLTEMEQFDAHYNAVEQRLKI